jgi:hypothetical protein
MARSSHSQRRRPRERRTCPLPHLGHRRRATDLSVSLGRPRFWSARVRARRLPFRHHIRPDLIVAVAPLPCASSSIRKPTWQAPGCTFSLLFYRTPPASPAACFSSLLMYKGAVLPLKPWGMLPHYCFGHVRNWGVCVMTCPLYYLVAGGR